MYLVLKGKDFMLDKNKFLKRGTSLFGTAAVVLSSSAPSLVSNSYTLDDYKIYRLVKFLGIEFLINFVKEYVEGWCISANCKKIKEFFENAEGKECIACSKGNDFVNRLKKTITFSFGKSSSNENVNIKFDLCASQKDPSEIELHKHLSILDDGEFKFTNLNKFYSQNISALFFLENTKFLKEVYDSFVDMGMEPSSKNSEVSFAVTDDLKVSINLAMGVGIPTLKISNTYKGKKENFKLRIYEDKEGALSIDEMREKIEKIKNFYKEKVQKVTSSKALQKSASQVENGVALE